MDEDEDKKDDHAPLEAHTHVEPEISLTAVEAEIEQPEATDAGDVEVEAEADAEADAEAEDSDEGEWQLAHDPVEGAYYWNTKTMEVPCALSCPLSPVCYLLSAAYYRKRQIWWYLTPRFNTLPCSSDFMKTFRTPTYRPNGRWMKATVVPKTLSTPYTVFNCRPFDGLPFQHGPGQRGNIYYSRYI
jgi:hypothetical protein